MGFFLTEKGKKDDIQGVFGKLAEAVDAYLRVTPLGAADKPLSQNIITAAESLKRVASEQVKSD